MTTPNYTAVTQSGTNYVNTIGATIFLITIIILTGLLIYYYLRKLEFSAKKILPTLKPTWGKIIMTIFGGFLYYMFRTANILLCGLCPYEKPPTCTWNKYILFPHCNCGCYPFSDVLLNYAGILLILVIIYLLYTMLATIAKRE